MRRLLSFPGACAAGFCLYAAFPPIGWWPLAFVGIALFVAVLEGKKFWGSFGYGFLVGLAFFIPLFEWASLAAGVVIAQIGLGAAEALFLGVLAVIWQGLMRGRITGRNIAGRAASFAVTWAAIEQLRAVAPFGGMPWGTLGFAQVSGPIVRLAPWGSTALVGGAVVAIGVLLEWAVRQSVHGHFIRASISGGTAIAFLVLSAFLPLPTSADSYIRIGFAQGIVPKKGEIKDWETQTLTVTENLAKASQPISGSDIDMMVWPESASDRDPRTDPESAAVIRSVSERLGVPLLLGTQRFWPTYRYNDFLVWEPDGSIPEVYTKQHPIPFGEYMPYREFFRSITSAVDQVTTDMLPGSGPAILHVTTAQGDVVVATPICFEVAVTAIVSEAVVGGAQVIVVPTNNSSFGESSESLQQFDMTRFRAIEQGRTAIQVSTVGVSGVIEPNGVVRLRTAPWEEAHGVVRVGLRSELTVATRYSQQIEIAFYGVGAALGVLALIQLWTTRPSRAHAARKSARKGRP